MWIAGVSLGDDLVVELAERLQRTGGHTTAQALLVAAMKGRAAARIDGYDVENILAAIDDTPHGFEELHSVLLRQIRGRR